jgi:NAD(P)-dependent dehydrogenase (short-subunit alcohol dehydrogenase family)
MLMSVIEGALSVPAYPELAGKRVLITGLTSSCGVDVVRAFAEHKGRLVLQFSEESTAMETVAEIVAPDALETKVYGPIGSEPDDIARFARTSMQAYGGLDVVINLVPLDMPGNIPIASVTEVERLVASQLAAPFLISKIAANRMNMVLSEGVILNVAVLSPNCSGAKAAFATVAKAGLVAMTRKQAEEWAKHAIRFNAIAPAVVADGGPGLSGEPDIAAMALYLASARGKALSGCVFDAEMA